MIRKMLGAPTGGQAKEVDKILFYACQQAAELGGGNIDPLTVVSGGVGGKTDDRAMEFGGRRGIVAEPRCGNTPVENFPPVASVLQAATTPRHHARAGIGVDHLQPARRKQWVHGQEPMEEAAEWVVRRRRKAICGMNVIASGQSHHRRTDLVRRQMTVERQERVGLGT